MLETKETELKITQSTNTFQRSKRLSNWDQSGQRWQSEGDKGQVTPKPIEPKATPQAPKAGESDGKKELSFKRHKDTDTFNGTKNVATTASRGDKLRAGASVLFGLGCLAIARLS